MPKVRLRKSKPPKSAPKRTSKKKKKKSGVGALERAAKNAVAKYEEERSILDNMRSDFEHSCDPQVLGEIEEIKHQEDVVNQAITMAKAKIGLAKTPVGDFTCQRSYAQAGYDDKKLTHIIKNLKDSRELIQCLLKANVISEFKVDKAASAAFAAANPKRAKKLFDAWTDRHELTTRVTVPKL